MDIGAIIIGSELLTGKRRDGHMARLVEMLAARGLELAWAEYLGDAPPRITAALARSMGSGDLFFSFGGIGATPDDHTRQCAADAAGLALTPHPEAVKIIEDRFGDEAYPQRVKMAHLPHGSTLIPNPVNRIAGFSVGHAHFVPGFPRMAWPMVEWVLDTHYVHLRPSAAPVEHLTRLPGVSEGQLMSVMHAFVARYPQVALSCLPSMEGDYRETELGVRGAPEQADPAFDWLMVHLREAGFEPLPGGRVHNGPE